jgi:serine/threonine protein kinase
VVSGQVIARDKLGELTKIGQGGQGVVYRAPNVKTKFAASMVYKEYKPAALAEIDVTALAAMPALVEDSLSYTDGERLISVAAWPCAIVQNGSIPAGFVMPAIPDEYFIPLKTVKGVSSTTAEFQHLLNHSSVLAARGIDIDDVQRFTLLREAASALAFLHKHGVCVGDVSPKNLLFSLRPHEAIYFIDCDGMRINGISALTQMQTPGWEVPAGEELATIYSDTYKLGLLALRLLSGDQDTKNPQHLPPTAPPMLRQLVTDTLNPQPDRRPLPEAWTYVLGHAIEHAQHDKLTAAQTPPATTPLAPPDTPTVRSRPSNQPPKPPAAAPPRRTPAKSPASLPRTSSSNRVWFGVLAAAAVVAVIVAVLVAVVATHSGGPESAAGSGGSAGSPGGQSGPCETAPRVEETALNLTSGGLEVGTSLQSQCQSADTISGAAVVVTVSDGARDVASGVFNLDAHPIVIGAGGQAAEQFVFPPNMYWRTPELVAGHTLSVNISGITHGSGGSPSGGSDPVMAMQVAAPAHGDADSTAAAALEELSNSDLGIVRSQLADRWVPQISSKRVGLVTDGITYANADILRNHLELRQRYDGVRLVNSGNWSSIEGANWWVTIVGSPSDDAAAANGWCDSHGIDSWNCVAKLISNTRGPSGTMVVRH